MYYWDLARYFTGQFRKTVPELHLLIPPEHCKRVLDLGGSAELWEMMNYSADITLLNISTLWLSLPETSERTYTAVVGDARQTDYADGSFDLAFRILSLSTSAASRTRCVSRMRCNGLERRSTVRRQINGSPSNPTLGLCSCTGCHPCLSAISSYATLRYGG